MFSVYISTVVKMSLYVKLIMACATIFSFPPHNEHQVVHICSELCHKDHNTLSCHQYNFYK